MIVTCISKVHLKFRKKKQVLKNATKKYGSNCYQMTNQKINPLVSHATKRKTRIKPD